ncbi:MAG: hypothetical protein ACE5ID_11940, partial [Acidobacteriota bacterium]
MKTRDIARHAGWILLILLPHVGCRSAPSNPARTALEESGIEWSETTFLSLAAAGDAQAVGRFLQ